MKYYVHTRAGGFRRWVCVRQAKTQEEALKQIEELQLQDDPMWLEAEYLISESLHPSVDEEPIHINKVLKCISN